MKEKKKSNYDFDTSRPAYDDALVSAEKRKALILNAVKVLQPCTDKQIAEFTDIPINVAVARRNELVKENKVVSLKKDKDQITGRKVNFWGLLVPGTQVNLF